MQQLYDPFYNPEVSYEENLNHGPYGAFADGEVFTKEGEPENEYFGNPVYLPFGIPAGPLPNESFTTAAFHKGFDICVYKTVRTRAHKTHPWPNIVPVDVDGDLTLEKAAQGLYRKDAYTSPIAITNSFGVGSLDPDGWQPDMKKAVQKAGKGQVLVGSFQGTNRGEGEQAFIDDHVLGARLVKETGAKVIEMNLSCPNEGKSNLLCFDTELVKTISQKVKEEIGDTPLVLKLAYFQDQNQLVDFISQLSPIVDGFATINTIASAVRNKDGSQALPGEKRLKSGVCGAPIKWGGLDMVSRLQQLRTENNYEFTIVGVGGVTTVEDYNEYKKRGADVVMSATGAMWHPYLAQEIWKDQ
ncbi:hypothetical protein KC726_00070 [Candidatus Woesebacteria bacterium]|nr:hypothetical protein [Candidatus Woesebacteria bacterium]